MTYPYAFEIGTDTDDILNLAALTNPVNYPKTAYSPYASIVDLEDNSQRGLGLPSVVWKWSVLEQVQRDELRKFCTGASAPVLITTRTNDSAGTFATYDAQMIWPSTQEEYDAYTRTDFAITFRQMVIHT
jgi:hypothetical protein